MLRNRTRVLAMMGSAIGLMAIAGSSAVAADNAKVWEGFLHITDRTPQCAGVNGTRGEHVSIYRPTLRSGASFLSIIYLRAAITLQNLSESTVPQMNGAGNYKGLFISSKARLRNYNSTYNFTTSPAPVVGATKIVTITGTINDIFNNPGCDITFDATYHKQP